MWSCLRCQSEALPGRSKGLCRSCYSRSYQRVKTGETSWEEMEEEGAALPDARGVRRKSDGEIDDLAFLDLPECRIGERLAEFRREIAGEVMAELFGVEVPVEQKTVAELLRLLAERMEGRGR